MPAASRRQNFQVAQGPGPKATTRYQQLWRWWEHGE